MSFTGDRNELLSTSTFLLSVHALLGDLTSSLSTGNTIDKEDVESLIRMIEKWKNQEILLLTLQEYVIGIMLMVSDKMIPCKRSCFWKGRGGRPPNEIL